MSSPLRSVASSGDSAHRHKPILADRFKTKLCRTFGETGACPYEERCMFAHGDEDLRTKEMNLEGKLTTEDAIRQFQRARAIAKGLIEDGDSSSAAGLTPMPMPMTPQPEAPTPKAEATVMLGAPRVSASAAMGQRFVAALCRPTALDVAALSERAASPSTTAKTPATTVAFCEESQAAGIATPSSQPETVACLESPAVRTAPASVEPSPAAKRTPTRVYRHNPYAPVTLGWAVPQLPQPQACISAAAIVAPMPTYAARIYAAAVPRCSAAPLPPLPMPMAPLRRAAPTASPAAAAPMSTYGPKTTYCAAAPVHEVLLA